MSVHKCLRKLTHCESEHIHSEEEEEEHRYSNNEPPKVQMPRCTSIKITMQQALNILMYRNKHTHVLMCYYRNSRFTQWLSRITRNQASACKLADYMLCLIITGYTLNGRSTHELAESLALCSVDFTGVTSCLVVQIKPSSC